MGTIISGLIWGLEGVTDAGKFYTGQGNYLFGDEYDSGYFNVVKNIETIVTESELFNPDYWEDQFEEPESTAFSFADLGRHIRL